MTSGEDFRAYTRLADALIDRATKDQLADVARLLALNIGWYQQRYGDVPRDALLKMGRAETLDDAALALVSAGMQNLVSALAEITGVREDLQDASRH
jgi:phosphoserine phosphatase